MKLSTLDWVRLAVQIGSSGYALWRSRACPLFFLYFLAFLTDAVCGELVFLSVGDSSIAYLWSYRLGSTLICLFVLWLTADNIPPPNRLRKCAIPAVLAITVARMVELECRGGLNSSKWLILAVAAFLFACGMILTTAAVYAIRNHTALLILGSLWLVQALYFFAYLIQSPEWEATGYWAPALIMAVGFVATGRVLPQPSARS